MVKLKLRYRKGSYPAKIKICTYKSTTKYIKFNYRYVNKYKPEGTKVPVPGRLKIIANKLFQIFVKICTFSLTWI